VNKLTKCKTKIIQQCERAVCRNSKIHSWPRSYRDIERFEIKMVLTMMFTDLSNVMPCSLVDNTNTLE
jgi:hypothetical protein